MTIHETEMMTGVLPSQVGRQYDADTWIYGMQKAGHYCVAILWVKGSHSGGPGGWAGVKTALISSCQEQVIAHDQNQSILLDNSLVELT